MSHEGSAGKADGAFFVGGTPRRRFPPSFFNPRHYPTTPPETTRFGRRFRFDFLAPAHLFIWSSGATFSGRFQFWRSSLMNESFPADRLSARSSQPAARRSSPML